MKFTFPVSVLGPTSKVPLKSQLKAHVQAFLVEAGGKKIVVDACVSDGRNRPDMPEWSHLQTDFMGRFKKVWQPEAVDIVLCTHMHFDHVGWNTTLIDGKWTPTFPNAQYIFSEREFNYWNGKPEKEMEDLIYLSQDLTPPMVFL